MKFNQKNKQWNHQILNYEQAQAYKVDPKTELYSLVATSLLSDQFYEKAEDKLQRLRALMAYNEPSFVAKLAVYAREQMYLRSVPLVLAVELAKLHKGNSLVSQLVIRVVQRADEITELLAYYAIANERKGVKQLGRLSKQVQKGLSKAFNQFDEYQFAKYNAKATIKLRDALFLVHPKAKDEKQQALFDKIANNALATPDTWEVALSKKGQETFESEQDKQQAFAQEWEALVLQNKLGYMAMLRNLRNMLQANVSTKALERVCALLKDPVAVAKSKQLPFRFLSAYREIKALKNGRAHLVLRALEQAVMHSAASIEGYDEDTRVVIAADVSGSMQTNISKNSSVQNFDFALMLAMLLQSRCKHVMTGMFGDTWKVINVPNTNILANVMEFHRREGEVGYATNGYLVIQELIKQNYVADKVMIFTDCQLWDNRGDAHLQKVWNQYKQMAPQAKLYVFDLAGYGHAPVDVRAGDVHLIAGWSDKIFSVLKAIEDGSKAVKMIEAISLE